MKKFLFILIVLFTFSGCLGFQIKSDSEILSSTGFIVDTMADYIKYKYPAETESLLAITKLILETDSKELTELYFSRWIDKLTKDIKDPFLQSRAKAILKSFEFNPNTSKLILDSGAQRTIKNLIEIFQKKLES